MLISQKCTRLSACSAVLLRQVLGGADLFLQGFIVPAGGLGDFSEGDVRALSVPGNPYPFAVGVMEVGSEEIAQKGLKGKGLKILHSFGDLLWALGDKSSPGPSFTSSRIFSMAVKTANPQKSPTQISRVVK